MESKRRCEVCDSPNPLDTMQGYICKPCLERHFPEVAADVEKENKEKENADLQK